MLWNSKARTPQVRGGFHTFKNAAVSFY